MRTYEGVNGVRITVDHERRPNRIAANTDLEFGEYQRLIGIIEKRAKKIPRYARLKKQAELYGKILDELDIQIHELSIAYLEEHKRINKLLRREIEKPLLRVCSQEKKKNKTPRMNARARQ